MLKIRPSSSLSNCSVRHNNSRRHGRMPSPPCGRWMAEPATTSMECRIQSSRLPIAGHPSDDEELSSSWRWMKKPASRLHNQSVNGQSSEFRMRRRSHSMSSVEHERVPSFLNPSTEGSQGSQGGRKDEDISLVRSSSWAVSCFVCGVLVTLFVISSQRRDLLTGHRLT